MNDELIFKVTVRLYISTKSVEPTFMDFMLTTDIYILFSYTIIASFCFYVINSTVVFFIFSLDSHFSYLFSSDTQSWYILYHPMDCSTPGLPVHHQLQELLKFMSIESVMPSNHLILCSALLLPSSIFPNIRVFSNESVLRIRRLKYWSFSFSISPFEEY